MKTKSLAEKLLPFCIPDYTDNDIALLDDVRRMPFGNDNGVLEDTAIIIFVRTGYMSICIDGDINKVSYQHVLVCRPGHHLSQPRYSDDFSGHAVILTMRHGQSILNVAGNIWNYLMSIDSSPVIELPEHSRPLLRQYYNLLAHEVHNHANNIFTAEVVTSVLDAMLYSLINDLRNEIRVQDTDLNSIAKKFTGSPQSLVLFHKFMDILISEHCTQRKIEYYAQRLCVTSKYLSTICKQVSTRTAHEWICDAVVNNIENSLRYSDKSIKEIAHQFGFTTLSFFSKFVKEHLGQAPTAFRKG